VRHRIAKKASIDPFRLHGGQAAPDTVLLICDVQPSNGRAYGYQPVAFFRELGRMIAEPIGLRTSRAELGAALDERQVTVF
jgi:hypothetical protein